VLFRSDSVARLLDVESTCSLEEAKGINLDIAAGARQLAQAYLDAYEKPAMDSSIIEELDAFRARRLAEGGVATDF
jgi:trimethylamine:corrinoid methyltransferase-like protein